MKHDNLRWTLRITLMFFVGVVPAILLLLIILVLMPLMGIIAEFVYWFALMAFIPVLRGYGGASISSLESDAAKPRSSG